MPDFYRNLNLTILVSAYFSDPRQRLNLPRGEVLIREGERNERLYLLIRGKLGASSLSGDGEQTALVHFDPGMFLGVFSFFSKTFRSSMTITAEEDCELAFMEKDQPVITNEAGETLAEQFMTVIMADLSHRHTRMVEVARDKERAYKELIQSQKLSALGQLAAGIAHELNNALSVLGGGAVWLGEVIPERLGEIAPEILEPLETGLTQGRALSSREARQRRKAIEAKFSLPRPLLEQLAGSGLDPAHLPKDPEEIRRVMAFWEIGATLFGMSVAARQAAHVVKSVKGLGAPHAADRVSLDLNGTVQDAMILLKSLLRQVNVESDLGDLPHIPGNRGELIQVWVNLIKNAGDSLLHDRTPDPQIRISSTLEGEWAVVRIRDNGPGIPAGIQGEIFQPNITTKVSGLSFGLGLGLPIVQRLVDGYGGKINFVSRPGETVFTVSLPVNGIPAGEKTA